MTTMLKLHERTELPVPAVDPQPAQPAKAKRPGRKAKATATTSSPAVTGSRPEPVSRYKLGLTVALGVAIPVLSLSMSKVSGTLLGTGHYALAAFGAFIGTAVLAVSLSHLAWAIRDVTGSGLRASWALAVALDLSLVLAELVHVTAAEVGLNAVCWCVVAVVALFSMILNVHAFLHHTEPRTN
jgi:hypothetical protein